MGWGGIEPTHWDKGHEYNWLNSSPNMSRASVSGSAKNNVGPHHCLDNSRPELMYPKCYPRGRAVDPDPHGSAFIFPPGSRRVNLSTKN